jgi:plasmid stabilization system protein ParE
VARKRYVLTLRAANDLREARAWSRARWGKSLTRRYFEDLHEGAQYAAENCHRRRARNELVGDTPVHVYPIREHYLVYEPLNSDVIAVVAVIRQGRDIPAILRKWAGSIGRELADVRSRIERGEIKIPRGPGSKKRTRRSRTSE